MKEACSKEGSSVKSGSSVMKVELGSAWHRHRT